MIDDVEFRRKYEDPEREDYVTWLYKTVRPSLIKKWEAELEKYKDTGECTRALIKRFIKDLKYMA